MLVGALNAVVDPYGLGWSMVERPGLNRYKPAQQTRVRLLKAVQVRQIKPQAIVLGTSRSHLGIRMSHPGWTAQPRFNLAFDGATTKEMYAYLRHAQAVHPLRQVVLGLDTWQIEGNPASVRPDFDPQILLSPDDPLGRARVGFADLRLLLSLDTLAASWSTLRAQSQAEPDWFAPDGQRLGPVFFRRPAEEFESVGPAAYFWQTDRNEIGFKLPPPPGAETKPPPPSAPPPEDSFEYIARMVAFCRAHDIDLRIFITPAHAHQMEISAMMDEWDAIERGKRRLVGLLAADAAASRRPPFVLWDFSGYSSVTSEAVPADPHAEMRFYWDSSHFKEEVGDWVLDRLFGTVRPGAPPPADFGRPLTPRTLDAALAEIRDGRRVYEAGHARDVAQLRRLVVQARAAAPQAPP